MGFTDFSNFIAFYNYHEHLDHLLKYPPSKQLQTLLAMKKTLLDASTDYMYQQSWDSFITKDNAEHATNDAIDLLSQLLVFDPKRRLTSAEALNHRFFVVCKQFINSTLLMKHHRDTWNDVPVTIKLR